MIFNDKMIKDICKFIGGSQPPKSEFIHKPKKGYVRLIQTRDRLNDKFITYIPKESTSKFCEESDILIGRYGPPIFQVFRGFEGAYNVAIMKADPINGVDKDYLYYFLLQKSILKYVDSMSLRTGGQTGVELDSLYEYPVFLPDKIGQERIAGVLKTIDNKIKTNNKINSELEAMAKTIYDYWFLQFEFPNEEGKPYKSSGGKMVWNEELKRELPEGWVYGSFKDMLYQLECGNRPEGGCQNSITGEVPSIGAEKITSIGRYDFSSEKYITRDYYLSLKKGIVKSNDVLLYKDGAGVGKSTLFKNGFPYEECAINSHVFILRTKENNLYQNFLYLTLQKEYIKKILCSLAMKAAQPGLNQPSVESVPTLIPNKEVVIKFNNLIDIYFDKIFINSNESKHLSSLRDFLLPLLMNGQVGFKENISAKEIESTREEVAASVNREN